MDNDDKMKNFNDGRWSVLEHKRFIESLKLYGKDWKRVQSYVATRSAS